jgi:hypothetical protein
VPKPTKNRRSHSILQQQHAALCELARAHRGACLRYARHRNSRGFDTRCARLLDQVRLTRSMLLTVLEDFANGLQHVHA